jgi:hypothetical protein
LASLDSLVRSPLRDLDGTFVLASLTADRVLVDREVHLGRNAGLLMALARAARESGAGTRRRWAGETGDALLRRFYSPPDSLFVAGFASFAELPSQGELRSRAVPLRSGAVAPRDPSLYASWNALAASAYVELYRASRDSGHLEIAHRVLGAVRRRMGGPEGGLRHEPEAPAGAPLLLEDHALVARAALDLFEVEAREEDLQFARGIADLILRRFADDAGLLHAWPPTDEFGPATSPAVDRLIPSAIGVSVQVLARLYAQTGEQAYAEAAQTALTSLVGPNLDRARHLGALSRGLAAHLASGGNASPETDAR